MSVDAAGRRRSAADRSLAALPASLRGDHALRGEAASSWRRRGAPIRVQRSLEAPARPRLQEYLQLSIETGGGRALPAERAAQLAGDDLGSANELHLDAFREHPEFASFRGRLELVRVPYLRNYKEETAIYDAHVAPQVRRHVAPHATEMAGMFAVLTRMRKPNPDKYPRGLNAPLQSLTAIEKADVYAGERPPERFELDAQRLLRANVRELYEESDAYPIYEGRIGASPREMRAVLLDAAQSPHFKCLSPLAVLEELEVLCERKNEFEWLQQDTVSGGYHDVKQFRPRPIAGRLLSSWETELYASSSLVDDWCSTPRTLRAGTVPAPERRG